MQRCRLATPQQEGRCYLLACVTEVPQAGALRNRHSCSQSWRLKYRPRRQQVSEACLLDVQMAIFSLGLHIVFSLDLSVS